MGSRHVLIDYAAKGACGLCYHSRSDNALVGTYNYSNKCMEQPEPLSPIRLVCRQIFFDTMLLPYSLNIFAFPRGGVLHGGWRGLQAEQRLAVRRLLLHVEDFPLGELLRLVGLFQGLRDVYFVGMRTVFLAAVDDWSANTGVKIHYLA